MSAEGLAVSCRRAEVVVLPAGELTPFRADDWRGALVIVQRGSLQVRCSSGRTAAFERGNVVYLQDVPLSAMGAADEDVVLLVVRRRPSEAALVPASQ